MEPCPYFENSIAVFASTTFCSRAWWSSRCSCSQAGTCPLPNIWACSLVGSVFNLSVMVQCLSDYPTFNSTAHYWTETFAKGASLGIEEKVINVFFFCNILVHWESGLVHAEVEILFTFSDQILQIVESHCYIQVQRLVEMGFPESSVKATLEMVGGDENMALEKLCSGWRFNQIVYVLSFEAGVIFTQPLILGRSLNTVEECDNI